MDNQKDKLKQLAIRYKAGLCSAEEVEQIKRWYEYFENYGYELPSLAQIEKASMRAAELAIKKVSEFESTVHQKDNAQDTIPVVSTSKIPSRYFNYAAAAIVLVFIGIAALFNSQRNGKPKVLTTKNITDRSPGSDKAILILSDGRRFDLNSSKAGLLAQQGQTSIQKTSAGILTYKAGKIIPADSLQKPVPEFNTVSTPRGGQYHLILPDGTKVWLNAASSIRFPVTFSKSSREVETMGEVYFEVAVNKSCPFKVQSAGQTVTVLGTHFNINAYQEEGSVVTTLIVGSVRVTYGAKTLFLTPGEASLTLPALRAVQVDTSNAIAWKNGLMRFADADFGSIMRSISRWYDIDVIYVGPIPERRFTGTISRKSNLKSLLRILSLSHIHFAFSGNRLIVRN